MADTNYIDRKIAELNKEKQNIIENDKQIEKAGRDTLKALFDSTKHSTLEKPMQALADRSKTSQDLLAEVKQELHELNKRI